MSDPARPAVTAVLGPTNTGKTHRALERLLEHPTGVIGLPLRLLAREVYDRLTARIGEQAVALVTGEERRVPRAPRYWVATVEAMPTSLPLDFVAVDEVQLMGDPERGHVFTDRVLRARGRRETALLGAGTAGPLLERLVPGIRTERHPRFSSLRHAGRSSLGGLPPRSAVVAFSADRVYELAARLSERRGGAAVVLGALSPRARNAQVALFQSGEVDYLVSTDAIGMGLNLDVHHVAFAGLTKFDGREPRALHATELAQIAGRAGRHLRDGTFGTLGSLPELDPGLVRAIETHRFEPLAQAYYRNAELDFSSAEALVAALRRRPPVPGLLPVARAEDLGALLVLAGREATRGRLRGPRDVERLWQVCQVPNYRGAPIESHAELLSVLFDQLAGEPGVLSPEFLERSVRRIDDTRGDLSMLLDRMAAIRTFTYATHRPGWVDGAEEWQERTRAVEDRLSDALHAELVARFVPGRARGVVLPRGAHHPFAGLLARLESLGGAREAPPPPLVELLVDAPHERFALQSGGRIVAGGTPVGRLVRGRTLAEPEVTVTLEGAGSGARSRLQRRLVAFTRDLVGELLAPLAHPLLAGLGAPGRGLAHRLRQGLGTAAGPAVAAAVEALPEPDRVALVAAGVRLGRHSVYLDSGLDAPALVARAALVSVSEGIPPPPRAPTFELTPGRGSELLAALGFVRVGGRAVRADLLERADARIREGDRGAALDEVAELLGGDAAAAAELLRALGPAGGGARRRRRRGRGAAARHAA